MRWENIAKLDADFDAMIKRHWNELSDEQVRIAAGRRALLLDSLQECYGLSRELAEYEVDEWIAAFGDIDENDTVDFDASSINLGLHIRDLATEDIATEAIR